MQLLAQAARDSGGITGIKDPSAGNRSGGVNLVDFPNRRRRNSTDIPVVFGQHGHLDHRFVLRVSLTC